MAKCIIIYRYIQCFLIIQNIKVLMYFNLNDVYYSTNYLNFQNNVVEYCHTLKMLHICMRLCPWHQLLAQY